MSAATLVYALVLAVSVAVLSVASRRLGVASPIVLLVAGTAIAFAPGVPRLVLDPEMVLLILLPPLLYASGVGMSWRGFRSNLRPILLLAIGCVLFTASAVAAVAHFALGTSWAVGFVLGAIVSPPDAVAPMSVLRAIRLPRRLVTVLEGESLVNDATALVAFSFALAAVATGTFSPSAAALKFAGDAVGEIGWGIAVGWAALLVRHVSHDPRAEVLLALATPFVAFWPPHMLGGSGVVACVTAGLWVSWNGRRLIRPETRLQGYFFWDLVVWAVEALVFLLTGLQARTVIENLAGDDWPRTLAAGALVTATVVVVRFVWVFPATYLPRLLPAVRRVDPWPDWRLPFLVSFAGLRGVVSMAAALSIPLAIDGRPFPDRDLVLFTTFCVIAFTLVGLGGAMPRVVGWLGVARAGAEEADRNKRDERTVRLEGIDAVLATIDAWVADGTRSPLAVAALRRRHGDRRQHLATTADDSNDDDPVTDESALQLELVQVERDAIARAYADNRLTDEARRRIERELDLEEARVRHALASVGSGSADAAE